MQTERVTFLTTPDHKAALDAFAASNGKSVGHVVREATSRYIVDPDEGIDEDEQALALLLPTVEAAVAEMSETIATIRADMERTCAIVDAVLAGETR
jgi:2',3'-cyclic-nucleotide 2'-phosphodiesterase (5'-nucleotidase family)